MTPKGAQDGPGLPLMPILAKTLRSKSWDMTFLVVTMGTYHPILVKCMEDFLLTADNSSHLCYKAMCQRFGDHFMIIWTKLDHLGHPQKNTKTHPVCITKLPIRKHLELAW